MQLILTVIIIAGAVAYVTYAAFRVLSGRSSGCGCDRQECPRQGKRPSP